MCSLIGLGGLMLTSCNDFLDREPITMVTPESYFTSDDQVGGYVFAKYDWLENTNGQKLFHPYNWQAGITWNDNNTDNFFGGANQNLFGRNLQVPAGQTYGGYAGRIRTWNYLIEGQGKRIEEGAIGGDSKHYLGEAYFMRALVYFQALANYGDFPIVKEVLPDDRAVLVKMSVRQPRNEVARFILQDLDKAISLLHDQGFMNNERINKKVAQLFKSRVALFEATFEKYHQGTGRVPGDATWPGKDKGDNKGKTFNIPGEIDFFLTEAMSAAKAVADACPLTENNHKMNPEYGQISGWNPYYDMFCTTNLSNNKEVLMWKEYSLPLGKTHDAAYILSVGGNRMGVTHSYVNSYLMKNGLPIYAQNSGYQGDEDFVKEQENRDERLQLFVFNPNTILRTDPEFPEIKNSETKEAIPMGLPLLVPPVDENLDYTGYRPRKFLSYDYTKQQFNNQVICSTACPMFRAVEAYLNYMEACYEKNHKLDADAQKYWRAVRERAGVDPDFQKTIDNTDLDKEANIVNGTVLGDLAVYSGDNKVDATLYNIRRERRCEFISEGMRWDDLMRWRSWDKLITGHYMVEGVNLWAKEYVNFVDKETGKSLFIIGGDKPNMSPKEVSTYVRPLCWTKKNNELYDGYTWMKAYYLSPLGLEDLTIAAENPGEKDLISVSYQNPYWPSQPGKALE